MTELNKYKFYSLCWNLKIYKKKIGIYSDEMNPIRKTRDWKTKTTGNTV
jgi:hypothetical protein